jgi:hypothetical protein
MPLGRKVIEEFEQYLLLRHRRQHLERTFPGYDFSTNVLPDGQAGCWAFRLRVGLRLQLAASGYEIEFDLLASALDAGLRAVYSKPLLMSCSTACRVVGVSDCSSDEHHKVEVHCEKTSDSADRHSRGLG